MKSLYRKVESFDGQTITIDGKPSYELGSFLGGGAAGVVYEGTDVSETSQFRPVAIKILNPVGFRLAPAATLRRCVVARRGQPVAGGSAGVAGGSGSGSGISSGATSSCPPSSPAPPSGGGGGGGGAGATGLSGFPSGGAGVGAVAGIGKPHKLGPEHVWWLVSPNTKQVLAAYIDPRYGSLVELPLPKCIEIWGLNPTLDAAPPSSASSSSPTAASPSSTAAAATAASAPSSAANAGYYSQDSWGDGNTASTAATTTSTTKTTPTAAAAAAAAAAAGRGFDAEEGEGSEDLFGEAGGPSPDISSRGGRRGAFEVKVDGMGVSIPWLPPKYVQWLSQRRKVKREINNMGRVGGHRNVLELLSVLELLQDSKSTLFLILELVTGGELLDHIRLAGEEGRRATGLRSRKASALRAEGAAQRYFSQLLSGLAYCHRRGVCHRDLSPSNLLLAESPQGDTPPVLKIADFGLSACCAGGASCPGNENQDSRTKDRRGLPHRVRSVVGSPYYMAPEVITGNTKGYDGFKADAWSCGVVLYTMLTQSLPFERDLSRCPRYKRFKSWAEKHGIGASSARKSRNIRTIPRFSSPSSSTASSSSVVSLEPTSSLASPSSTPSSILPPPSSAPSTQQQQQQKQQQQQGASSGRSAPPTAAAVPPVPPPAWLFPPTIPPGAKSLLLSLLAPNPSRRMSVQQALSHPWLVGAGASAGGDIPAASPGVQGSTSASMTPATATAGAATAAAAAALVDGNGAGGPADAARELVAEVGHGQQHGQQQQQQQQGQPQGCGSRVGSGAFFTVPAGRRGSVANDRITGGVRGEGRGGRGGEQPDGSASQTATQQGRENGDDAESTANDKASLLARDRGGGGGGRGSATANMARDFGCLAIPSTTSFP